MSTRAVKALKPGDVFAALNSYGHRITGRIKLVSIDGAFIRITYDPNFNGDDDDGYPTLLLDRNELVEVLP